MPFLVLGDKYARAVKTHAGAQPVVFPLAEASQIDALLARYELAKVTVNALNRRESLQQFVEARQAEGEAVMIDQDLIDEAGITNWQQVSMGELRAFRDALKNLEHLANFKNKLLRKKKAIDFALVKDELLAAIDAIRWEMRDPAQ